MSDWFVYDDGGRTESKRPKSKNDCVVRSWAIAAQIPYDESYDFWSRCRKAHGRVDNISTKLNLEKHFGWRWTPCPASKGHPRMHHEQFCAEHPVGRFLLKEAGHVSAVVDGQVRDIVRPYHERCIYGYWEAL